MDLGFLEAAVTATATILGIYFKDYLERRRNKQNTNLESDLKLKKSISSILEEVRYELDADKVQYWVFSNGDVTLSGFHLKKLSVLEESSIEGFPDVGHQFQLVPAKKFEKHLELLNESENECVVIKTDDMSEDLADLYSLYDVKKVVKVKVRDSRGRWTGVLSAWYKTDIQITDGQLAFARIQAARIGTTK